MIYHFRSNLTSTSEQQASCSSWSRTNLAELSFIMMQPALYMLFGRYSDDWWDNTCSIVRIEISSDRFPRNKTVQVKLAVIDLPLKISQEKNPVDRARPRRGELVMEHNTLPSPKSHAFLTSRYDPFIILVIRLPPRPVKREKNYWITIQ